MRAVDPDELAGIGQAIHGPQWQRPLAADIPVGVRTLQRWAAGDYETPAWVRAALIDALDAALAAELARLSARRAQLTARPQIAGLTAEIAQRVEHLQRLRLRAAAGPAQAGDRQMGD